MAPQPDSEGYTFDTPQGLNIRLSYWKDDEDRWALLQDITGLFMQRVGQVLTSTNPIFHAFDDHTKTLKSLFDLTSEDLHLSIEGHASGADPTVFD